jgi:hypothetical protein
LRDRGGRFEDEPRGIVKVAPRELERYGSFFGNISGISKGTNDLWFPNPLAASLELKA